MASVVFTFGRMSPPTMLGHGKLIQKVISEAKARNADYRVYLSQTQNKVTDPLEWNYKRRLAEAMFPGIHISTDKGMKSPFHVLEALSTQYENITFVVGDDRTQEFREKMAKYADKWNVQQFQIVSAGSRNPLAEGAEGMSSSKMRKLVSDNDYVGFAALFGEQIHENIKQDVYHKLRTGMGLE
jgi:hypothetical protein